MSQSRRTIERLLTQKTLPIQHTAAAAKSLGIYPSKDTWRTFFDKTALIIGVISLTLALVFFIAYNWQDLSKIGKFALVESALAVTIALYVALSFRGRFKLIRQLLLLIASVITGSLLALFGQVYQTGADTWQLFAAWAVLIIPWVLIARFPALWLLWLGLFNTALILSFSVIDLGFVSYLYQNILQVSIVALVNFIALNLWLFFIDNQRLSLKRSITPIKNKLHWSTYIVGLLSTCITTLLAIVTIFDEVNTSTLLIPLALWACWYAFMVWRFYKHTINLLMLTYMCGSIITIIMSWSIRLFLDGFDLGGFLFLTLLLIGISSAAVIWLRNVARLGNSNGNGSESENQLTTTIIEGHELNNDSDSATNNHSNSHVNSHLNPTLLQLQQLGLIDVDAIDIDDNAHEHTPWFIQTLFGFSGLLASGLFIVFLLLLLNGISIFESVAGLLVTGLLLSAGGFALFKNNNHKDNTFISSLAFTISVSGQVYIAAALLEVSLPEPIGIWLFLLIQIVITTIVPNPIYRLLSVGVVIGCLIYLLNYYDIPEAVLGVLALITVIGNLQRYELLQYLSAPRRNSRFEIINAVAYASAAILLAVSVYFIAAEYGNGFGYNEEAFFYNYFLAQTLLTLASLYAAYLLLKRYHIKFVSLLGMIATAAIIVLGALSVYVSGLLATSLVIIIAMANSQRVLLGLSIAALVGYIFWYYYQLDTSLLIKSLSMFIIGIAILLMRWLLVTFYLTNSVTPTNISDTSHKERLL
ncbi:MAG: DUF4401 domain-containing protein [Psychrobacter sp.]|uniref:DUF4401 domain-containing protein n=1 Tax=Psychrobacter sp. AOP7-B1-24 TaxID=3457645 RepID=UPI003FB79FED